MEDIHKKVIFFLPPPPSLSGSCLFLVLECHERKKINIKIYLFLTEVIQVAGVQTQ